MLTFLSMNKTSSILIILISFFCVYLFIENKKLRDKLTKIEKENKKILEEKVSKQKNDDSIPINKITAQEKKQQSNNNSNQLKKIELVQKYNPKEKQENSKLYQKNILHDKPTITSPVSISGNEEVKFNLNEFIKKSDNNKEDIKLTDIKKESPKEILQDISNIMAEELKPQTIELTDYEKEQEDNAIISYKELLNVKDKITMLDDEEENVNFIEELKNLRNSLK